MEKVASSSKISGSIYEKHALPIFYFITESRIIVEMKTYTWFYDSFYFDLQFWLLFDGEGL